MGSGGRPATTWTVLFTDQVGSTEQRVRVGERTFDHIRGEVDRRVAGVVAAHDGTVVKTTGDGMMARFNGTAAAVRCAVAIQRAVDDRNRRSGEPVLLRVGISVGDAVAEDGDLHGTAVVEAARLCAAAGAGTILCSDTVRAVSANRSGCTFSSSRTFDLKGLPDPVVAHEVDWRPEPGGGPTGPSFAVLGPLEVRDALGAPIAVGGLKEQLVLAVLLAHAGEVVSIDSLVDAVWADDPPRTAERTLHAYIARLRAALEPDRGPASDPRVLVTVGRGYRLVVDPGRFDVRRFEAHAADGAGALEDGEPATAADLLGAALAEWRGDAYTGLTDAADAAAEAHRLDELRLATIERRTEAELGAGRAAGLVPELERLVHEHPFRERLWRHLMLALYRSGRQRDALDAYQRARAALVELGLEPGADLRGLEAAMLAQDPSLDTYSRRPPTPGPGAFPLALQAVGPAFVGRETEAARLQVAWEAAASGAGSFVSVLGIEGVGKTRLLAHLARRVHDDGGIVLYGRCDNTLRGAASLVDVGLRGAGGSVADLDVVGGDVAGALARHLPVWSGGKPVLLLLDDLHIADADTLEFVADLAGWCTASPLLVVGAFRSDAVAGGDAAQLVLGPLDVESVGEICALYDASGWTVDEVRQLAELTGGVPLFVHEQASAWARDRAGRRVTDASGRVAATRSRLQASRGELADGVEGIQRLLEQRRLQLAGREAQRKEERVAALAACPYKGLARFEPADAANYFGRERLVAELVARVAESPLLAVVGPSGSGKSSLVRAGLLPSLADGVLAEEGWRTVLLCPGPSPADELAARLAEAPAGVAPLGVFVDQFEEIFQLDVDAEQRAAFVDRLLVLSHQPDTAVVLALRADHLASCTAHPDLAAAIEGNDVLVGPMQPAELRRTIELPAMRAGLEVEPGLVEVISSDVAGRAGTLPLLSTALAETWERRQGRTLTVAGYQAAGGVNGALARLAEDAYASIPEQARPAARRILLRLCDVDDLGGFELRRRVAVADILDEGDTDGRVALEAMADRRLLGIDDDIVEVAHEALLREWPRLRTWLEEDAEGRRVHARLAAAARGWDDAGRDPSELYRGTRLGAASEFTAGHDHALNRLEAAFLEASRAEADRELAESEARAADRARTNRRLRRALVSVGVLLVGALVAVGAAAVQTGRAADQRDRADARAEELALRGVIAQSDVLRSTQRDLAALLAVGAYELDPRPETFGALLGTFTAAPAIERSTPTEVPAVAAAEFVADTGAVVVVESDFGLAMIDTDTGGTTATLPPVRDAPGLVYPVPFDNGSAVAVGTTGADGSDLAVWDVPAGALRFPSLTVGTVIGSVAVDPEGDLIAVAGGVNGTTEIRSSADGALVASVAGLPRPADSIFVENTTAVAFLPDGRLAIAAQDGTLRIVDPRTGAEHQRVSGATERSSVRILVSSDGRRLYGYGPRGVSAYDLDAGAQVWMAPVPIQCFDEALVEGRGEWLCANADGRLVAIDLTTGAPRDLDVRFQNGAAVGVALTPAGDTILQVGNGLIDEWHLDDGGAVRHALTLGPERVVQEILPDGTLLVSTRTSGLSIDPDIVDAVTGQVLDPLDGVLAAIRIVDRPDLLGVAFDDGTGGQYDLDARARMPGPGPALPFVPNGGVAVSGRSVLWDETRIQGLNPDGRQDPAVEIPTGFRSVVVSVDGSRLYTLEGPDLVQRLRSGERSDREPIADVDAAVATADLLVTASGGQVRVRDAETLEPVGADLPGAHGRVGGMMVEDDGERLLVNSVDLTIQLADLPTRVFLGDPIFPGLGDSPEAQFLRAVLSPDGDTLAYDTPDGVVLWDLHPESLRAAACRVAGRDLTAAEWEQYLAPLGEQRPLC